MRIFKSCAIAFSLYSAIPMPSFEWNKRDMEYVFCFFPLIGAISGAVLSLWLMLARLLGLGNVFTAVVCVVLPLIVTGGIHLDGFLDTMDALASRQSRERKLEILKDSNAGAFAVIGGVCYMALCCGIWHEALTLGTTSFFPACIFVLSRVFSGLAAVTLNNARGSGMLATFTSAAAKRAVIVSLILWLLISFGALLWLNTASGFAVILTSCLLYAYFYYASKKNFGGVTGDLCGWFLSIYEPACVLALVLAAKLA